MINSFIHPEPISLKVADFLRNAIIHGELKPGERLNEALLSSKLRISRSPIREAFRILESENLVEIYSRRGTFVKRLSVKDIEEITPILIAIEATAARSAANNMNDNREKELKLIIKQLEKSFENNDLQKYASSTMRVHNFIINASENGLIRKMYNYLETQIERIKRAIRLEKDDMAESLKEHVAISKALLKHDGERAEKLLKNHYNKGILRLLKNLQKSSANAKKRGMGTLFSFHQEVLD